MRWRVLGAVYITVSLLAVGGSPIREGDSPSYFRLDFTGGEQRTWTVPLIYQLPDRALVTVQTVGSAVAWCFLAWAVATTIEHRAVRYVAAGVVLVVGLSAQVVEWNAVLLSESLTVTLLAALLAATLRLTRHQPHGLVAVWCVLAVLWFFTRQINLLLAPLLAVALLIAWVATRRSHLAVMAGTCLLVSVWAVPFVLDPDNETAEYNRLAVIADRVMVEPDLRAHFEDDGMPVTPALEAEAGDFGGGHSRLFDDGPTATWARDNFTSSYVTYAIKHPVWTLTAPLRGIGDRLTGAPQNRGRDRIHEPSAASRPWLLYAELAAALAVTALAWLRRGADWRLLIPAGMIAASGIMALVVWHLSTRDTLRLYLPSGLLLRLAAVLALAWGLDRCLRADRRVP